MDSHQISSVEQIKNPDRSCSQVPFWFWNGELNPEQMRQQVAMMVDQQVTGMMPHPRFGMDRRYYLEAPYWEAMDATIEQARKLDAKVYLYDEYNWPSGAAGGRVTDGRPDLYPSGLDYVIREATGPGFFSFGDFSPEPVDSKRVGSIIKAFRVPEGCPCFFRNADSSEPMDVDIEQIVSWGAVSADGKKISGDLPSGNHHILIFFRVFGSSFSLLDPGSDAFIDYMNPEAVDRFIALTHEQYRQRYGRHFGTLIPAIFTDEPSTISGGPFPWTADFAAAFRSRCGYDLLEVLPALCDDRYPDGYAVRADYWRTVAGLMEERFFGKLSAWCRNAGIALTGHVFDEGIDAWPSAPHLMNWLRHFDWPGIDALGVRARTVACKIPASVAHLEESKHFVCEALGLADGWNVTLGIAKRGYQFLAVMGVDLFIPHAFHQTVENPSVECPPSYFYQNLYWPYYHQVNDLTSRLCAFNRQGTHVAPVAVYYPIESLWADGTGGRGQNGFPWQITANGNRWAQETIQSFEACLNLISAGPFDCDVVDARAILSGTVDLKAGQLQIGPEAFSCVIIPAGRTLDPEVIEKLMLFVEAGGFVFFMGRLPERWYPKRLNHPQDLLEPWLTQYPHHVRLIRQTEDLPAILSATVPPVVAFPGEAKPEGVYVLARKSEDSVQWLFVNDGVESRQFSVTLPLDMLAHLNTPHYSVQAISPDTGSVATLSAQRGENGLRLDLCLGNTESYILVVSGQSETRESNTVAPRPGNVLPETLILNDLQFKLLPAELTGQAALHSNSTVCELPRWKCCKSAWKRNEVWFTPGFDDSEWTTVATYRGEAQIDDRTVYFRAVLPPGAFALQYPLPANGEYLLYINGQLVEKRLGPPPKDGLLLMEPFLTDGRNVIAIEVNSASDFPGLIEPLKVHCRSTPLSAPVAWDQLGLDWYSGRAIYSYHAQLSAPCSEGWLDLGEVQHYAEIWVNGAHAETRLWAPYKVNIAPFLTVGDNQIDIIVSNSVANRFTWDQWTETRTGKSWNVPPKAEPSGLIGPVQLTVTARSL